MGLGPGADLAGRGSVGRGSPQDRGSVQVGGSRNMRTLIEVQKRESRNHALRNANKIQIEKRIGRRYCTYYVLESPTALAACVTFVRAYGAA